MPSRKESRERRPETYLQGRARNRRRWLWGAGAGILFVLTVTLLVASPIVPYDTDLWFQMSHGRFISEHGVIPDSAYFSFIQPPRQWVDYSWFFQLATFQIHRLGGYHGLLLYRGAAFALSALMVWGLLAEARVRGASWAWPALIFALYVTSITQSFELVRPHTVSFALIPTFLYLLERRRKALWLLMPLAIVWVNSHGVEYPVMISILGIYAFDLYARRLKDRRAFSSSELRGLAMLAAAMACLFLTPHGWRLIRSPFLSTSHASLYIDEMRKLSLGELFTFSASPAGVPQLTAFNLLFGLGLAVFVRALYRRELEPRHALLFACGALLLSRGLRFTAEFSLLAIPLLAGGARSRAGERSRRWLSAAAAALLVLTSALLVRQIGRLRLREYPLSPSGLPHGVTAFLNRIDVGGSVMNHPNVGGHLRWELDPGYRIFMDIEIPFIFSDVEFFEIQSAYYDPASLARFVARYDPELITVQTVNPTFERLIPKHPEYVPVFFDDALVLYVDREAHPDVARRFALRLVDPYALANGRLTKPADEHGEAFLTELERLHELAPDVFSISRALAALHSLSGRLERAVPYAEAAIRGAPEQADGYKLRADALAGLGRSEEAIGCYLQALRRASSERERQVLHKGLAAAYAGLHRTTEAYASLSRAVELFDPTTPYDDLFYLGRLALLSGDVAQARRIFELARFKLPAGDKARRRLLEEALEAVEAR